MTVMSGRRMVTASAGIVLALIGAASPALAYWGGYGYYGDGPRPYYGPPPAYYVPFYRPRVLFVPPPPVYEAPVYEAPVYRAPVYGARGRTASMHPKPTPRRNIHHAALRHVPAAPGPKIHVTPRLGDLPGHGPLPVAASPSALPWLPHGDVPASVPPAVVAPPALIAPAAPPVTVAPLPAAPVFTPFVGD